MSVYLRTASSEDPSAEAAVEALKMFPEIETVSLVGPGFNDASVEKLALLPRLRTLNIADTKVTGEGLARIGTTKICNLRWLGELIDSNLSRNDEDASDLAKNKGLQRLMVESISDVGLERLSPLTKLAEIEVIDPVTPDAACKFSASHPKCLVVHNSQRGEKTFYRAGELVLESQAR